MAAVLSLGLPPALWAGGGARHATSRVTGRRLGMRRNAVAQPADAQQQPLKRDPALQPTLPPPSEAAAAAAQQTAAQPAASPLFLLRALGLWCFCSAIILFHHLTWIGVFGFLVWAWVLGVYGPRLC